MSKILIVVPTLNSYLLLPKLIDSLCLQTYHEWRLVFVDGFSNPDHINCILNYCALDSRFNLIYQNSSEYGIFGAMNQGFQYALDNEWLLFWGSDDWAATPNVLFQLIRVIKSHEFLPDMVVCRARYFDAANNVLARSSVFQSPGLLNGSAYRKALFFGSTPPHQASLIGPGARARLSRYSKGFSVSADLDYFLQLSRFDDLSVQVLDLELVHMSSCGISAQQTRLRLREVRHAYHRAFGWLWLFPYLMRYLLRTISLLETCHVRKANF